MATKRKKVEPEVQVKKSEAVRRALSALERDGKLTATEVLDAARDPESPLHSCFEWDDDKAAEGYRLEQARTLIRSVEIRVQVTQDRVIAAHYYVRDPEQPHDEQGYVALTSIQSDPDAARAAVYIDIVRIEGLLDRVEGLSEALGLVEVVQSIKRRVGSLKRQIQPQAGA